MSKKIAVANKVKSGRMAKLQKKLLKRGVYLDYTESKGRVDGIRISLES